MPSPRILAGVFIAAALSTSAAYGGPLRWKPCDPQLVGGTWPELGERLHCGTLSVPRDHADPKGPRIDIGVVRIASMDSSQREGSLFVNIGGPGGQPAPYVTGLAAAFSEEDAADPVHGNKRRLAERLDIIAVIPRGLRGGWTFDCLSRMKLTHTFLPTARDDANWQRFDHDARTEAEACGKQAGTVAVSTMQHVHDMDMVRAALGEDRIHFYGVSYGGRVGTWYAATYPGRVDRMLLDSSIDATRNYRTAIYLTLDGRRRAFEAEQLGPVLDDPALYGQPPDQAALAWAMRDIRPEVRAAWHDAYATPEHVAAALTLNRWIQQDGWHGVDALARRMANHLFSPDGYMDTAISMAAYSLLDRARVVGPHTHESHIPARVSGNDPHFESVNIATLCNDEPWFDAPWKLRARADNDANGYPLADGVHVYEQLVCWYWPARRMNGPDLEKVAALPSFLVVQSEQDATTPLRGALDMLSRLPSARLIIAEGARLHGLLGHSLTPCVERDAVEYLLSGTMPAGRETRCSFIEATFGDPGDVYETSSRQAS